MRVLVTGGHGQLGRAVSRRGSQHGHEVFAFDVDQLDIRNADSIDAALARTRPQAVINAAAYTAVDKAESDAETAFAVNARGATTLAERCRDAGTALLHVSTDYVFDGYSTRPYREDDATAPLGVYGASKAEGERGVHGAGGTVVRTSWLFEERGPSFVHTMLRLCAAQRVLRVVDDQHGCPTWADDLADALIALALRAERAPTYHFCNDGSTTWCGFARAIVDEVRSHRSVACERVDPITTGEYPTAARRPMYSVLDTSLVRRAGITPPPWRIGLAQVVGQVLAK